MSRLLAFLMLTATAWAQTPINLPDAVRIALEKNPARKAALAEARAAKAGVKEAQSALLPRIVFSETATRGNDPVYAFGTRLRQRRFTAADFALDRLNTPAPIGNFSTRFSGQWNIFDSFAKYKKVGRARDMQAAASRQLERTSQELVFQAIDAYYGVLLALRRQEVAEQSGKTAEALLQRAKARYESGLAVQSDFLSAEVNTANRRQQLIEARNQLAMARAHLSYALGLSGISDWQPAENLSDAMLPLAALPDMEQRALVERPDLKTIAAQESAQEKSVSAARSAFGPKLNVFAGWEADNPTLFAGGGGNNWTGGVELEFDLFSGGQKAAQLTREKALQERVAAMRQAAENAVRLEVRRAYYDADTASQQVEVARAATEQAKESLRINQNRYDSGLATITDLLRVEETDRAAQSDYWAAIYRYRTGYARLQLAIGDLGPDSPVVTQ